MAWTYDPSDLGTDTPSGRINAVRFLVGDTDSNDQQVQDEEISFALLQTGNDVYAAGTYVAQTLAAKYSRLVSTELDGALRSDYSDLAKNYRNLSVSLRQQGQRFGSGAMGIGFGGITISDIEAKREDDNRVQGAFRRDRFRIDVNDIRDGYVKE